MLEMVKIAKGKMKKIMKMKYMKIMMMRIVMVTWKMVGQYFKC